MEEREFRHWIERVKDGTVTRRQFTRMMVGLGLTAPMAAQMLAAAGVAQAQPKAVFNPTKRGGGGPVKTLWWQAPVLLNPHLSPGTKDVDASRIFHEPLCSFDPDGNLLPVLAAEVPTLQNGGVSKDGLSVTWKLKKNVTWHDGKPFTADDVVATWEWVADPASAAVTSGAYKDIDRMRLTCDPSPAGCDTRTLFAGTFDRVQRQIFDQSCALSGCHDSQSRMGGLLLETGAAYANLVGAAPTNPAALAAGWQRITVVDPALGDPVTSLLFRKIDGPPPGFGGRMPFGRPRLDQHLIDVVERWIAVGAPAAGWVPGTD